jgi:inward rectifier potassium channel
MRRRNSGGVEVSVGDSTTVLKLGTSRYDLRDPYHLAVALRWPAFIALFMGGFLGLNLLFALLYTLEDGAIAHATPGSIEDAFFFSIETLATVGYGGMAPGSRYGHIVASAETVVGLAFTAVTTGLIFVRFSRPRPNLVFADSAVIGHHDKQPTLMIRVAYAGAGMLVGAEAHLDVLLAVRSSEGKRFLIPHELPLVRRRSPVLLLTWTLMHVIDTKSPLHGLDAARLKEVEARVLLTIHGRDRETGSQVYDVKLYEAAQIRYGSAYSDVISYDDQGRAQADLGRVSEIEAEAEVDRIEAEGGRG